MAVKFIDKKEKLDLKEKTLRVMFSVDMILSLVIVLGSSFMNITRTVTMLMAMMFFVSIAGIRIMDKHKGNESVEYVMVGTVNNLFIPVMFFAMGGIQGGVLFWYIYKLTVIFMIFSGRKRIFFSGCTLLFIIFAVILGYINNDRIYQLSLEQTYICNTISLVMSGVLITLFMKYQQDENSRQTHLTEQRSQELESMSRSQSAFFANMSHEIRTPINTIIGLNEMILREDISDEIAENAINIQNASKMLLVLINDILDLSKLESGKMEIVPVQYETGAMFSDLVNLVWIRAHDKGLEFKIDISEELPSMLYGDEVRLKQVLTNILTNAVKYTQKGSVTLTAKSERIGNNKVMLKISVEDTGIGIKKENLRDLFSSFKRIDEDKNRNIEGTGLGLSISKQLIEMMGGEITIDSIYTKGSVFTVTVEQEIVDAVPVGSVDFMVKKKLMNREKYQQIFEAPEVRVLIVDDNEMNLMVAKKLLRATRVQVDTAKSGKECLKLTQNNIYHVIFMDHMMPEMDGEETLRQIKIQENGHCQNVPVIALTANVMTGAEKIYQEKGFAGYLAKPINGALLEATLLKYIPQELVEYTDVEMEKANQDTVVKMISHRKKKKIAITTDCLCDLPDAILEKFDIKCMYYYVHTEEGRFCDTKEISSDNLLKYLENPNNKAHSSPALFEEYEHFMASALSEAEKVIHISMASKSSDGFHRASVAANGFDNVKVFDSGHLSSGMGIVVLHAAQMAKDGYGVEEICDELEKLRDKISTSFIIPRSDNMYRNGMISKKVKNICDTLSLHPVLYLNQNMIKIKYIEIGSIDSAYRSYIQKQLRKPEKIDKRVVFITYAGCSYRQLQYIQEEVKKYVDFEHVILQKTSATISCNCGIGTFGIAFMYK